MPRGALGKFTPQSKGKGIQGNGPYCYKPLDYSPPVAEKGVVDPQLSLKRPSLFLTVKTTLFSKSENDTHHHSVWALFDRHKKLIDRQTIDLLHQSICNAYFSLLHPLKLLDRDGRKLSSLTEMEDTSITT